MRGLIVRYDTIASKQEWINKTCHLSARAAPAMHEQNSRTTASPGCDSQFAAIKWDTIIIPPLDNLAVCWFYFVPRWTEKSTIYLFHNCLRLVSGSYSGHRFSFISATK